MACHSAWVSPWAPVLYIHRSYCEKIRRQMSGKSTHRWQSDAVYAATRSGWQLFIHVGTMTLLVKLAYFCEAVVIAGYPDASDKSLLQVCYLAVYLFNQFFCKIAPHGTWENECQVQFWVFHAFFFIKSVFLVDVYCIYNVHEKIQLQQHVQILWISLEDPALPLKIAKSLYDSWGGNRDFLEPKV